MASVENGAARGEMRRSLYGSVGERRIWVAGKRKWVSRENIVRRERESKRVREKGGRVGQRRRSAESEHRKVINPDSINV